ncbi:uncharacterized protein LOC118439017 [Folsomia candida]|uniref:uncharacterized protein LOC118439017 n=1 Tax=Folsomia candida TaxID=158441 RepID=UPI0016050A2D|nr:uncharacterized protein LOC118439017 [Folsomia candida]
MESFSLNDAPLGNKEVYGDPFTTMGLVLITMAIKRVVMSIIGFLFAFVFNSIGGGIFSGPCIVRGCTATLLYSAPRFLQINHDIYLNLETSRLYQGVMLYWNYRLARALYERDTETMSTWLVINVSVTAIEFFPLVLSYGIWSYQENHPYLTLGEDMVTSWMVWSHSKDLLEKHKLTDFCIK